MAEDYRLIQLTQGQYAKVSVHRFEELNQFKWFAWWCPSTKSFYAARDGSSQKRIYLHRCILGLGANDRITGDHINHDTLDCTDGNLRIATPSQQSQNRRQQKNNTSGFRGVVWVAGGHCWKAQIQINGKNEYLGLRPTAEAAYRELYVPAAIKYFGEFACL